MPFEVTETPDGTQYRLPTLNSSFTLPACDLLTSNPIRQAFDIAIKLSGELADETAAIANDLALTELGRAQKLAAKRQSFVEHGASSSALLDEKLSELDANEQQMLAVPEVEPAFAAATATREAVILKWWTELDVTSRSKVQDQMFRNPAEHLDTILAVLRAPKAMHNEQTETVRKYWEEHVRSTNKARVDSLADGRKQIEWAKRGLAHVVGVTGRVIGWDRQAIATALATSSNDKAKRGGHIFNIGGAEIAQAEQRRLDPAFRKQVA